MFSRALAKTLKFDTVAQNFAKHEKTLNVKIILEQCKDNSVEIKNAENMCCKYRR